MQSKCNQSVKKVRFFLIFKVCIVFIFETKNVTQKYFCDIPIMCNSNFKLLNRIIVPTFYAKTSARLTFCQEDYL